MKIGVFDSGIGGLTVLSELRKRLGKSVDFLYYGDTAHVPYGTKSPAQIERLSLDAARAIQQKGVSALVIACNTATSHALPAIRKLMNPVPVLGVVQPGIEAALSALLVLEAQAPILVLATRATVKSGAYRNTLRDVLARASDSTLEVVPMLEQACPLLVPMIEEGWIDHPILHSTIAEYVGGYASHQKPGVALLGCTHYPWIHAAFEKALPAWKVVDSAWAVARSLEQSDWYQEWSSRFKDSHQGGGSQGGGNVEWIFTDPDAVPQFARKWISG